MESLLQGLDSLKHQWRDFKHNTRIIAEVAHQLTEIQC